MKELTGAHYLKQTWFGLVLVVEERIDCGAYPCKYIWRKAKAKDLAKLKIDFFKVYE